MLKIEKLNQLVPEKIADISRHHHWFSREMTAGKRPQKFYADEVSLPRYE